MKRTPKPGIALALLAIATLVAACGSDSGDGDAGGSGDALGPLTGLTFLSTSVTQDDKPYNLVDDTRISLTFTDNGVSANAGCNHLGADARYTDGTLVVLGDGMSMTEMGCDPPRMDQDTWLADILTSKPSVVIDGDRLTVTSGGTVIELVDKEVADPDQPLTGTLWTLDSLGQSSDVGDDGMVSSIPSGVSSTLTIDEGGGVSLSPGCNSGGGEVEVGDTTLTFGPIALTRKACPSEPMDIENAVMKVIDGEVDYRIDGTTLVLTKGLQSLTYRAQLS